MNTDTVRMILTKDTYTEVPKVMGKQYVNLFLSGATVP
jgi:hypothetical protein